MSEELDASGHSSELGVALIEFATCQITKFGYPNDEAWSVIPRTFGLIYGAYEVINSSWPHELVELNRHAFPNTRDSGDLRHFLFLFHDSSFECLAKDLKVEILPKPYSTVFDRIRQRVLKE